MPLDSVDDLRADALFRAGEPQDSSSPFYTKALDYLNRALDSLLLGGSIAVGRDLATSAGIYAHLVDVPITDWWWAHKHPRGVFTTLPLIETGTATATKGSATVTLSTAPVDAYGTSLSVAGFRLEVFKLPTVPVVRAHQAGNTTLTLDDIWPEDTQTASSYVLFKAEYALPDDFLRFAGAPYLHSRYRSVIPVSEAGVHDSAYPLGTFFRQPPTAAAMLQPGLIQVNSYDTRGYRFEFDYIPKPAPLQSGGPIPLPHHYRQVLSSGAAMLICFDKGDGRAENYASEFREIVGRMVQEHRKFLSEGSNVMGQFRTRQTQSGRRVRIQPRGEEFLI